MMEFTISRVVLCVCGVVLFVTAAGVAGGIYDWNQADMDDDIAERIAHILDRFESSDMDDMILDGPRMLPSGCTLVVHDGFVELRNGERMSIAGTLYPHEFTLDSDDVVRITRRTSQRSS